jgi:hypothetical protein
MYQRLLGLFCVLCLSTTGCAAAMTPAPPPQPRPEEEPIDTEAANREAKRPPPGEGEEVPIPPPGSGDDAAGGAAAGGGAPAAGGGRDARGSSDRGGGGGGGSGRRSGGASGGGGGGGGAAGGGLTKAQCDEMIDHYVELVVAGNNGPLKGTSGKELENAKMMIRQMVSQDPNMQGLQRQCLSQATRKQYSCSVNARDAAEWQSCVK